MQKFTGKQYIMLDIANQAGLDKRSWSDRLNWVNNEEKHLQVYADEVADPILYKKACRALLACDRGEAIGFPMSLDATASGLQILAVLSGCPYTAMNVNLMPTGNREDIYQKVADELNKLTNKDYSRAQVKKPIMTTFYGSKKQPMELFGDGTPELIAFYTILAKELPGAMELMGLLQSFWNPEALEHIWSMPDGHLIRAKVMSPVDKKIEVDELAHKTFTHRAYINQRQDKGLSLAANIVHSIDGYIVREMVRRAHKSNFELATIHDSFWTHPNHMNEVRRLYIQILAEIADMNLLQHILDQLQPGWGTYTKKATALSKMILQSDYALS